MVGVSIGIAVAAGSVPGADPLLKSADMALFRAKADGRGIWRIFEPEMDAQVQARRSIELDLREAMANGQFELVYQPQLDLATCRPVGFEALLRWRHPERGMISPAQFIPIAEQILLI